MMKHRVVSIVVIGACGLLTAAGCGRSPEAKKARHLERGERYFSQGQYKEAIIEYRNLLRLQPTHPQAPYRLGLAHYRQGEIAQAHPYLLRAVASDPDNLDARHTLGTIALATGKVENARREAESILDRDPAHFDALILFAATARTPEERDGAIARLEAAEATFGDRAKFHVVLGTLYWSKNDPGRAHAHFKDAVAKDPSSIEAHTTLGEFYLARGDPAAAEAEFAAAAALAPAGSVARLRLADFYLLLRRPEQARKIVEEMTQKAPDFLPAWRRLAEMTLAEGRHDDAARAVAALLKRQSGDPEGLLLRGRLHLARRQTTAAIEELQSLVRSQPSFGAAWLELARAHVQAGNLQQAKSGLTEAIQRHPNFVAAHLLLAELNLRTGAASIAIQDLERLLGQAPQLLEAYSVLGSAHLMNGQPARATEVYRRFAAAVPKDPRGPYLVGTALRAQGKVEEARKSFEAALALAPGFTDSLAQLVSIDFSLKKPQAALDRVNRQIAGHPASATTQQLLGDVHLSLGDQSRAEAAYLKAIDLDAARSDPYLRLARIYGGSKRYDDALRRIEATLKIDPRSVSAHMLAGVIHQEMGNLAGAQQSYARALEINPRFAPAANNLAWILSEHRGDQNRALELAQAARTEAPDDPRIADTLGWILYRLGTYNQAVPILAESAGKLTNDPVVHYHLGMAHFKAGNEAEAVQALQRAAHARSDFKGKDEAQRTLDSLELTTRGQ